MTDYNLPSTLLEMGIMLSWCKDSRIELTPNAWRQVLRLYERQHNQPFLGKEMCFWDKTIYGYAPPLTLEERVALLEAKVGR